MNVQDLDLEHTVQREAIPTGQRYARDRHTSEKCERKMVTAKVYSGKQIGPDDKMTAS